MKHRKGFTLVELMVVIAIIAFLAGVAAPMYSSYVTKTRAEEGRIALTALKAKQEIFRSTNFTYATNLSDLPGYSDDTSKHGRYYLVTLDTVADASSGFRAVSYDGQKSIGSLTKGSDQWVITESLGQPCHTKIGYGGDPEACADGL